jgi:ribosome-associated protein
VATKKETTGVKKSAAAKSITKKSTAGSRAKKSVEAAAEATIKIIDTDAFEVKTIAEAMLDKKAKNVCSLDLKEIGTSICDYFVICNADSTTNVLAIADNVEEEMIVKCNRKVHRMQGKENGFWIILDFSNIVVHIFQTEYREFYRLEDLWADAKMTKYEDE